MVSIKTRIHKNNFQNSYLYYRERLFSSLRIMHVLKYCYIENVTVCVNYTNFYTRAKRGEAKPSNNISERRMSKANEPVSEHSERASGYALGCMSSEWNEVLVYPEYTILFICNEEVRGTI